MEEEIRIDEIIIEERIRTNVNQKKVESLAKSINLIGLINPILITKDKKLIAGKHRILAFKQLGLEKIPCRISLFKEGEKNVKLLQQLQQIDENLMRIDLHYIERAEHLRYRKEIYEKIFPKTKKGGDHKSQEFKSKRENIGLKSFSEDTSNKTGLSERTIEQDVQIARDVDEETKEIILGKKIKKQDALEIARLKKEFPDDYKIKQKEMAIAISSEEEFQDEYEPEYNNSVEFQNGFQLYKFVESISRLSEECELFISKNKIVIKIMDGERIMMTRIEIKESENVIFSIENETNICLDFNALETIMKCKKTSKIVFKYGPEKKVQKVKFIIVYKNYPKSFVSYAIDYEFEEIPLDNLLSIEYSIKLFLDTDNLISMVSEIEKLSDLVVIEYDNEKSILFFRAKSQMGEVSIPINEKRFIVEDDSSTKIKSGYSILHLKWFLNFTKNSKTKTLLFFLKTDHPLRIDYYIEELNCNIYYFLAPRVDADEEEFVGNVYEGEEKEEEKSTLKCLLCDQIIEINGISFDITAQKVENDKHTNIFHTGAICKKCFEKIFDGKLEKYYN